MTTAVIESEPRAQQADRRSVLSVQVGHDRFAMDTCHVEAFFDISQGRSVIEDALRQRGMDQLVQSLPKILSPCLTAAPASPAAEEKALITIRDNEFCGGLRVESVSRPVELPQEQFFALAPIARCPQHQALFNGLVVRLSEESLGISDDLTFMVDPLAALGQSPKMASPEPPRAASRKTDQVLVFLPETARELHTIDYLFCLLITDVAEVISAEQVIDLPYDAPFCEGFLLWRGMPVPVVRMARLFGMEQTEEKADRRNRQRKRRFIIARAGENLVAFGVNAQMQTLRSPSAAVSTAPHLNESAPIIGTFRTEMGDLIVPDLPRIYHNNL